MNKPADTEQPARMNRRQAILRVTALLGGTALVGGAGLWAVLDRPRPTATETPAKPPGDFTSEEIALLDEIAETILPATKTPGAKAAQTGTLMAVIVADCYSASEQKTFREGMRKVDAACKQAHNVPFIQATPAQRLAVLTPLDVEQKREMDAREAAARREQDALEAANAAPVQASANPSAENSQAVNESEPQPAHYFRMMKELALLGFFTSEIGYTQVMRYSEVPSRFDPCIPYHAGEPQWAPHA